MPTRNTTTSTIRSNSLYFEWASVYLTEPYRDLVNKMKGLLDNAPIKYGKLKEVFTIASKYEYMYWSMAYDMGGSGLFH